MVVKGVFASTLSRGVMNWVDEGKVSCADVGQDQLGSKMGAQAGQTMLLVDSPAGAGSAATIAMPEHCDGVCDENDWACSRPG